jgi:hypothetical protein
MKKLIFYCELDTFKLEFIELFKLALNDKL